MPGTEGASSDDRVDGFQADGNTDGGGSAGSAPVAVETDEPDRYPFAERQRRPRPTEPGDIDGGMVPGGLTHQQIAPELDRGLGLLDILEKGEFAVITAPAAGLEQLREVIESSARQECTSARQCRDRASRPIDVS